MTYRVKNWSAYQHYKDRAPQWVKLYRNLLDDLDWHQLRGDDAKGLVMLWLLAAESEKADGALPELRKIAFRLRLTEQEAFKLLARLEHWVEQPASNVLAEPEQPAILEERRGDTEERKNKSRASARGIPVKPDNVSTEVWDGFLALRRAKRAPVTQAVLDGLRREATKAGWQLEAAIRECVERGWQGFRADWVVGERGAKNSLAHPDLTKIDYSIGIGPDGRF